MSQDRSQETTDDSPNIAIIVLDTLRKDVFDEHFEWLPGRRFENAWAPSHWTVPVHGSLFTGKYPSETGVHAQSPAFDTPELSLAEQLHEMGYMTRAYSSNVNISERMQFDRGFREFQGSWRVKSVGEDLFDWSSFAAETNRTGITKYLEGIYRCFRDDSDTLKSLKRGALLKLRDLDLNGALIDDGARKALRWLRNTSFGDEEFLFVNLMEAHSPYLPPRGYRTVPRVDVDSLRATIASPDAEEERIEQAYEDSVRYLSDKYREIYAELKEEFEYIITLSDHGELLGEHGAWDHLHGLYPELTHIPLVIDGPEMEDSTVTETVSLLDVHATVLDLVGVETDSHGRTLLGDVTGGEYLTEQHGISSMVRDSLESDGFDVTPFDSTYRGITAPVDYYGYEDQYGFHEQGTFDEDGDPHDHLQQLVGQLEVRSVKAEGPSEELRSHLEDLGYA